MFDFEQYDVECLEEAVQVLEDAAYFLARTDNAEIDDVQRLIDMLDSAANLLEQILEENE